MARFAAPKVLALASITLAAGLALPGAANAGVYCNPLTGKCSYHPSYAPAYGYGAAALAGGLAVGALAATAAASATSDGECFVQRRRVYDEFGNVYVRRIRVCE